MGYRDGRYWFAVHPWRPAAKLSLGNPDFSVIPVERRSQLTGYFERDSGKTKRITLGDLTSDGTSLLDTVEILEGREFTFVLSHSRISGYVHYSDLNHELCKTEFLRDAGGTGGAALGSIGQRRAEPDFLSQNLPESRLLQVKQAYKRAGDAGRSLVSYLNIADLLRLAVRADAMLLDDAHIRAIKDVRDGAAHVSEDLVLTYGDVKKLAQVKRECLRLLGGR